MSRRRPHRGPAPADDSPAPRSEMVAELEKLGQETKTDSILDSLERELRPWATDEEETSDGDEMIEKLNRDLIARSVFREGLGTGFHEDVAGIRPIESDVVRGLDELKKLIELGKPPRAER